MALRASYRAGVLDGAWLELDATGGERVRGQHQAGHRVGIWTTTTADGATMVDHGPPDPPTATP